MTLPKDQVTELREALECLQNSWINLENLPQKPGGYPAWPEIATPPSALLSERAQFCGPSQPETEGEAVRQTVPNHSPSVQALFSQLASLEDVAGLAQTQARAFEMNGDPITAESFQRIADELAEVIERVKKS